MREASAFRYQRFSEYPLTGTKASRLVDTRRLSRILQWSTTSLEGTSDSGLARPMREMDGTGGIEVAWESCSPMIDALLKRR